MCVCVCTGMHNDIMQGEWLHHLYSLSCWSFIFGQQNELWKVCHWWDTYCKIPIELDLALALIIPFNYRNALPQRGISMWNVQPRTDMRVRSRWLKSSGNFQARGPSIMAFAGHENYISWPAISADNQCTCTDYPLPLQECTPPKGDIHVKCAAQDWYTRQSLPFRRSAKW